MFLAADKLRLDPPKDAAANYVFRNVLGCSEFATNRNAPAAVRNSGTSFLLLDRLREQFLQRWATAAEFLGSNSIDTCTGCTT